MYRGYQGRRQLPELNSVIFTTELSFPQMKVQNTKHKQKCLYFVQLEAAAYFKGKTLKGRVRSPVLSLSSDTKDQGVGLLNCLLVSSPAVGVSVESGWINSPGT